MSYDVKFLVEDGITYIGVEDMIIYLYKCQEESSSDAVKTFLGNVIVGLAQNVHAELDKITQDVLD